MRTRQCAIYLCLGIATTGTRNDGTTSNTRVMLSGEQWRTVDRFQGLKQHNVLHKYQIGFVLPLRAQRSSKAAVFSSEIGVPRGKSLQNVVGNMNLKKDYIKLLSSNIGVLTNLEKHIIVPCTGQSFVPHRPPSQICPSRQLASSPWPARKGNRVDVALKG